MITSDIETAKKALAQYGHFYGYMYNVNLNYINKLKFVSMDWDFMVTFDGVGYLPTEIFLTREEAAQVAIFKLSEKISILAKKLYVGGAE